MDESTAASVASEQAELPSADTKAAIARWCKHTIRLSGIRKQRTEARRQHTERQKEGKEAVGARLAAEHGQGARLVVSECTPEGKPVYMTFVRGALSYRAPNKKIVQQAVASAVVGSDQTRDDIIRSVQQAVTERCQRVSDTLSLTVSKKRGVEFEPCGDDVLKQHCSQWAQARAQALAVNDADSKEQMAELRDSIKADEPQVLEFVVNQPSGLVLNIRGDGGEGPLPFVLSARRRGVRRKHDDISECLSGWEPDGGDLEDVRTSLCSFIINQWEEAASGEFSLSLKRKAG